MSKLDYTSVMAHYFDSFIRLKRNLGYKYTTAAYLIGDLDRFLVSKGLTAPVLTKELCEEWMERRGHEEGSTYKGRCGILVEFARYMADIGMPCFIPRMPNVKSRGFTAHVFTEEELGRFFHACDNLVLESLKKDSVIIMLPSLFRLLYGTGIRVSEALRLKDCDVHLDENYLVLRDTKNGKDRLVPFSPSVSDVLKEYASYRDKLPLVVDKGFFFLSLAGRACRNNGIVYTWFRRILYDAGIPHQGKHLGPRVHDFRHTFSVKALVQMYRNGSDLYCSLPILSMYLGHSSIAVTDNYVRLCESMYPEMATKMDMYGLNVYPELIGDYETD